MVIVGAGTCDPHTQGELGGDIQRSWEGPSHSISGAGRSMAPTMECRAMGCSEGPLIERSHDVLPHRPRHPRAKGDWAKHSPVHRNDCRLVPVFGELS